MKKQRLIKSYIAGIVDRSSGESFRNIFGFFIPELVVAFLLNSLLNFVDAYFIGQLHSTATYATQGVTITLIYFLLKIAEGISIGTVVVCGQHNGLQDFKSAGRAAISSVWVTIVVGALISSVLFFGAHAIYAFFKVSPDMITLGVQFLRLRAVGIFLGFLYFALLGFLRGIKRPSLPMRFFLLGAAVFIFFDYALIFGRFGFPALQYRGSALAAVIQYACMLIAAIVYIIFDKRTRAYSLNLLRGFDLSAARDVVVLSLPAVIDKATMAAAKIWLVRLLAPMGTIVLASFNAIHTMEHLAFVPAAAFAQVVTFLVSNDYSTQNWLGIKNNIKKILFLSSIMVFSLLGLFSLCPTFIVSFFDQKGIFTSFAARAFPLLSVLVFLDLLQLILAGALRGAANGKTVMWTRLCTCLFFFGPLSYMISYVPIASELGKFLLLYGSYYISNGLMGIFYIQRFRRDAWKYKSHIDKPKVNHDQDYIQRDTRSGKDLTDQG